MTLSGNLTGDSQASYAPNPAIQPAQSINFRDLIPTVRSVLFLYTAISVLTNTGNEKAYGPTPAEPV